MRWVEQDGAGFGTITGMKMPKIEFKKGVGIPMSMQLAVAVKKLVIHGQQVAKARRRRFCAA